MQFSPFPCYLVPLRPKHSPQHPILKHLSLRFSLNFSDQVSHPYRTTGKFIVLYNVVGTMLLKLRQSVEFQIDFRSTSSSDRCTCTQMLLKYLLCGTDELLPVLWSLQMQKSSRTVMGKRFWEGAKKNFRRANVNY
jgi:hypothetical protein